MPGQVRQEPEHQVVVRLAERGEDRQQHDIGRQDAAQLVPEVRDMLREGQPGRSPGAAELLAALLEAGTAGDVAEELAAIARARDRKRRRQTEVRIVRLLRGAVMLEVV